MKFQIVESKLQNSSEKSIIVYGISEKNADFTDKVEDYIQNTAKNTYLVLFRAGDWDRDFSPWPAQMPGDPDRCFSGGGPQTLKWLQEELIPAIRAEIRRTSVPDKPANKQEEEQLHWYICGYSLSGLFALWAFYETGLFEGVAACSATLWFDGWESYLQNKPRPTDSSYIAYLSLGGKEPRTSNPVMSTIGTCYEKQKKRMKEDPSIRHVFFEWNPGGHFADPQARVLKGIRWLQETAGI